MKINFYESEKSQRITASDIDDFEKLIGRSLPKDYREHMLEYNGGIVDGDYVHVNYPDGGEGIAYFHSIKYGSDTMEEVYEALKHVLPAGYISIGITDNHGEIILSLNDDETYGNTKEYFPDGDMYDLSPSFTRLLNDMRESDEEE